MNKLPATVFLIAVLSCGVESDPIPEKNQTSVRDSLFGVMEGFGEVMEDRIKKIVGEERLEKTLEVLDNVATKAWNFLTFVENYLEVATDKAYDMVEQIVGQERMKQLQMAIVMGVMENYEETKEKIGAIVGKERMKTAISALNYVAMNVLEESEEIF